MLPSPAPDACDSLMLDVATQEGLWDAAGDAVVIDDASGALTAAALEATRAQEDARVLCWVSSAALRDRFAELFAAECAAGRLLMAHAGTPSTLRDALEALSPTSVLLRLPRSLRALESATRSLAAAGERTQVVAGGNVKHMTRGQNAVLELGYRDVHASLGRGKHRCLIAKQARESVAPSSMPQEHARLVVRGSDQPVTLCTYGGVFGGAQPDPGSMLLLQSIDSAVRSGELPRPLQAVDFGCGNGLLTTYLAHAFPEAALIASDDDADAVFATRATAEANGVSAERLRVMWDTSLSRLESASCDLILLNPPFHDRNAVDATLVQGMLDGAARALRPGGELWLVHNSHLRYRAEVERRIGVTEQRGRDARFTVLRATHR